MGAPVWTTLAVAIAFFGWRSAHFLSPYNLSNILLQATFIGLLSIAQTLLIISRNIDLSVGSPAGLTACLTVGLQPSFGVYWAIVAAIGAGVVIACSADCWWRSWGSIPTP